jgi:hypothetical protein
VQASDPSQQIDASRAVLLGQETRQESPGAFIGGSKQSIDPAVLPGSSAVRVLLAGQAGTPMDDTRGILRCHTTLPLRTVRETGTVILSLEC